MAGLVIVDVMRATSKSYTQMRQEYQKRAHAVIGTQPLMSYCPFIGDFQNQASPAERADTPLPPGKTREGVGMATSTTQSGRVVRISTNGENGEDVIHELYAVAIDDDQGALDAFHEQFAVYDSATHIVGPLRAATLALLTLAQGQAAPL